MFCRQTFEVWQPLKQTVTPKVSCLYVFDQQGLLIFHFSQLSVIFVAQKQHTCLQKLFLTSKNSCKQYFDERKQIKSTTAAYSKLQMFGGKTCHVWTQSVEHDFSSRVHAYMQPTVVLLAISRLRGLEGRAGNENFTSSSTLESLSKELACYLETRNNGDRVSSLKYTTSTHFSSAEPYSLSYYNVFCKQFNRNGHSSPFKFS